MKAVFHLSIAVLVGTGAKAHSLRLEEPGGQPPCCGVCEGYCRSATHGAAEGCGGVCFRFSR